MIPTQHSPLIPEEQKGVEERQKITGEMNMSPALVQAVTERVQNISQLQAMLSEVEEEDTTKILSVILVSALPLDASDIHIEPETEGAKMRFRIDGMLQDIADLPLKVYESLRSRIKLISQIKLNVTKKPQDGRFSFPLPSGLPVEVRTATLPSEYGESIVLRILNPKNLIALKDLGLRQDILSLIKKELKKPNGMILATGPTGCGKTTTLYAFLKEINRPELKLVTIEDPIEYHLGGVSQTQVHPEEGYTFASGLQAIVRQDPDVILVGEIRDKDTARISLQAALTGHLVFSTLHTNDAPGTISRLTSLGAEPINISAASNFIIGQRLIRKACKDCVVFTKITQAELQVIREGLQGLKSSLLPKISAAAAIARPKGCKQCNDTGYKGRVGIFEAIPVDSEMEEYIMTTPSTSALRKFAVKKGMVTMHQDAFLKVLQRITTLEEVERVTGEYFE